MIISTATVNRSVDPAPWFHKMRVENPVAFDPDIVYYFGIKGGGTTQRYFPSGTAFTPASALS